MWCLKVWQVILRSVLTNVKLETNHMVDVAQLVERQIVALVVVGSIPIIHPPGKCYEIKYT